MNKEKIEKVVGKVLAAQSLMREVGAEITSCDGVEKWHIFREQDFMQVCDVLGIEYSADYNGEGDKHLRARYKELEIICVVLRG